MGQHICRRAATLLLHVETGEPVSVYILLPLCPLQKRRCVRSQRHRSDRAGNVARLEPDFYLALPKNKSLLTDVRDFGRGNRDEEGQKVNALLEGVPAARADALRELIKHLFPPVEWVLGGSHYGADWTERWSRELRVCSEDMFDRYFHFVLPPGDLSQEMIERLMAATGDREALRLELEALASRNLLELAMDRLRAYKQQIPLKDAVPFVTAMFDMGDQLSSERAGMFEISSAMHAERIIYWFLKEENDPAQRGAVLRDALGKTDGGIYLWAS